MKTLVIGGGPTGLTAALELATRNISCRLVERRTEPSVLSRAIGIVPSTIDALKRLGIGEAILAEAMPLRKIELVREGKALMRLDNTTPEFRNRVILGLPQNRTEDILRSALAERDVEVEYGVSVEAIKTDDQSATVQFSDGKTESYDWVIAADGIGSLAREQLGIAYPGIDLPGKWSIADVDVAGDFDPELVQLDVQGPGNSFLMILPIEARRARIVSSTPDALAAMNQSLEIETVRRRGEFQISIRQAETYSKGRVLLAGDAAHCHSPLGGKGMNLGMADAVAAATAIATGQVDNYSAARRIAGADVLKSTEVARKITTSNNPAVKALLWLVTRVVPSIPAAHRAFMRLLTQL